MKWTKEQKENSRWTDEKKENHSILMIAWHKNRREKGLYNSYCFTYVKEKDSKKKAIKAINAIIAGRLRSRFGNAIRTYTKTGKYQTSKKYGVDYKAIINHLKPFPKDLSKYHIDHIKPCCAFDLTDPEQIKECFHPKNHQWLLAHDNLVKNGNWSE